MTEHPTLFDEPTARVTDPPTSHAAARIVRRGNHDLIAAIRAVVGDGALTAFEIADRIIADTDRWQPDTIRTACARAGLTADGVVVRNGRPVQRLRRTPTHIVIDGGAYHTLCGLKAREVPIVSQAFVDDRIAAGVCSPCPQCQAKR